MKWISVKERLPDINKGDGNTIKVRVKYEPSPNQPSEGVELYGTSGFFNEPISFFGLRKVTHWKPLIESISELMQEELPEPPKHQ